MARTQYEKGLTEIGDGLYAFTGKSIAFLGPLAFAFATSLFDSQRIGIATILIFWLAGLTLLLKVKEK